MSLDPNSQKKDNTNERVTRKLKNVMNRLNKLQNDHNIDIYFCARHYRYFEYSSSEVFRPPAEEIVRTALLL